MASSIKIKLCNTAMKVVGIGAKALKFNPEGILADLAINVGVNLVSSYIYDGMNKPKSLEETKEAVEKANEALRKTQGYKDNITKKYKDTEKFLDVGSMLKQSDKDALLIELLKKAEKEKLVNLNGLYDKSGKPKKDFIDRGMSRLKTNKELLEVDMKFTNSALNERKSEFREAKVEFESANLQNDINKIIKSLPTEFKNLTASIKNLETKINNKLKLGADNTNPKGINSDLAFKIPEYCKRLESAISKLETDLNAKNGSEAKVDIDMKINDSANTVSSVKNGTDCEGENSQLVYETISTIKDKLTDIYKKIEDYFPKFIMKNDCGSDNLESSTTNAKGAKPSLNKVGFQVKTTGVTEVSSADSPKNNQTSLSQKLFGNWKETLKDSAAKMGDWSTNMKNVVANTAQSLQSTMSTVFLDAFQGKLKSFKDYFKSFASSILQLLSNALANSLVNSSTKVIAGKKADGGTVTNGNTYLVGERGPELFVANTTGTIIPNNKLGLATSTVAPQVTVNVINNSGQSVNARQESRFDGQSYVVDVWLDALNRNVGGLRDVVLAGR